jgi:hypothetical protein
LTPAYSAERFNTPAELKANGGSTEANAQEAEGADTLEGLIARQLQKTMSLFKENGFLSENNAHIALFNAIMQNRDQFLAGTTCQAAPLLRLKSRPLIGTLPRCLSR